MTDLLDETGTRSFKFYISYKTRGPVLFARSFPIFLARFHGRIPSGRPFLKTARPSWLPNSKSSSLPTSGKESRDAKSSAGAFEFPHNQSRTLTVLVPYGRSVKSQATVQAFDVLCEVQSDKASVGITNLFDGVLKEILVKEGRSRESRRSTLSHRDGSW